MVHQANLAHTKLKHFGCSIHVWRTDDKYKSKKNTFDEILEKEEEKSTHIQTHNQKQKWNESESFLKLLIK